MPVSQRPGACFSKAPMESHYAARRCIMGNTKHRQVSCMWFLAAVRNSTIARLGRSSAAGWAPDSGVLAVADLVAMELL